MLYFELGVKLDGVEFLECIFKKNLKKSVVIIGMRVVGKIIISKWCVFVLGYKLVDLDELFE